MLVRPGIARGRPHPRVKARDVADSADPELDELERELLGHLGGTAQAEEACARARAGGRAPARVDHRSPGLHCPARAPPPQRSCCP